MYDESDGGGVRVEGTGDPGWVTSQLCSALRIIAAASLSHCLTPVSEHCTLSLVWSEYLSLVILAGAGAGGENEFRTETSIWLHLCCGTQALDQSGASSNPLIQWQLLRLLCLSLGHSVPSRGGGIKKYFFSRFFCRILKSYVGIAYKKFGPPGATKFDPENHV